MTTEMNKLAMSGEARLFYRASCKQQDSYIKVQLDGGIDPPKIYLELDFIKGYYQNNDLAHRGMDLIVEELVEVRGC